MTRRNVLRLGIVSSLSGGFYSCGPCAAGFPPNLAMPVFQGFKDYSVYDNQNQSPSKLGQATGPWGPRPLARVFYPSIDGTPDHAAILIGCELFPLVLLVHGACPGGDPYQQWYYFAGQLARAGYVVAITSAGGFLATGDPAETIGLRYVHDYMRNSWEYRDTLMPSPNTAVIGHSYGGTDAAELAGQIPLKAFVGLSGTYGQVLPPLTAQSLLSRIHVPSLFLWNANDDPGINAEVLHPNSPLTGQLWTFIGTPKHGVAFTGGAHGDYLSPGTAGVCTQGRCDMVRPLAVDLATTFLTKYLPPQGAGAIPDLVPDSLIVRPQDLPSPPNHGFYAGQYLTGLSSSVQSSGQPDPTKVPCFCTVYWEAGTSGSTFLVPA